MGPRVGTNPLSPQPNTMGDTSAATSVSSPAAPPSSGTPKTQEDPQSQARNSDGLKKHAIEARSQQSITGSFMQRTLLEQTNSAAPAEGQLPVQMSAPVGAPAELPGKQMTVTIYDSKDQPIATHTVPVHGDAETNTFTGEIKGGSIDWGEGNKVNVRIGDKVDKTGKPTGGVSIEQWVREKGKGQARYIKVDISGAMLKEGKEGKDTSSTSSTSAKQPATTSTGKGSVGESEGTPGGASKSSKASGSGTPVENAPQGANSKDGRVAPTGAEDKKGKTGGTETGNARGNPGGHKDGKVTGKQDGNKKETGYFHDPNKTGKGQEDVKRENAVAGGMVGGEGKKGDEGTTTGGGVLPKISLPKGVAAAVALATILTDANVTAVGDDMVKSALKLGKKGGHASDALKATVKEKFDDLVKKEMDTLTSNLKKDPEFKALGPRQQAEALADAKVGLHQSAHTKVSSDLDRKIAEAERLAKEARANPGKYSKDVIEEQEKIADAARQAKEAMPSKRPHVENPDSPKSPYHPDNVAKRKEMATPEYEPNPAHNPKSPKYNPKKTPEPKDAGTLFTEGKVVQEDFTTWYAKGKDGYYRYKVDQRFEAFDKSTGRPLERTSRDIVHFNGIIPEADVPKAVKDALK